VKPSLFDRWHARAAGVLALVATAIGIWSQLPQPVLDGKAEVARLELSLAEMGRHFGEEPEQHVTLFDDARGRSAVESYADGCTALIRRDPSGQVRTRLVMDLTREASAQAGPVDTETPMFQWGPREIANVFAGALVGPVDAAQQSPGPGRCVAYHADAPRTDWGQRLDKCRVELVYTYDGGVGCVAVAIVDTCNGSMVRGPVFTRCVH